MEMSHTGNVAFDVCRVLVAEAADFDLGLDQIWGCVP